MLFHHAVKMVPIRVMSPCSWEINQRPGKEKEYCQNVHVRTWLMSFAGSLPRNQRAAPAHTALMDHLYHLPLVKNSHTLYVTEEHAGTHRNTHTHIHTHTRLRALFSRTTRVSRYQKGKTSLDFTEARDSEWQWHQLGHMQVCTSLQSVACTPPLSF